MRRIISLIIAAVFLFNSVMPVQAQGLWHVSLPEPGTQVGLTAPVNPTHLLGLTIDQKNPLVINFLINKGDRSLSATDRAEEYKKVIKYFLAAMTIPDDDQWVNLSPYEQDRIIPDGFGLTEMGRDLLAQDYILKQLTASLIDPDKGLGRKFWDGVYAKAYEMYGTTDIPFDTFNKVWIAPDEAAVFEKGNAVIILKAHLKVMLEEDYLSREYNAALSSPAGTRQRGNAEVNKLSSDVVRQIIIPELEKEVNTGANFANLRQIVGAMVLATWYKRTLKASLLGELYADKARVKGVDQDPANNRAIYDRYVEAFRKGVFNLVKEDRDRYTDELIPRKYFSGGYGWSQRDASLDVYRDKVPADYAQDVRDIEAAVGNVEEVNVKLIETSRHPDYPEQNLDQPIEFTHANVLSEPLADPEEVSKVTYDFTSYVGAVKFELITYADRKTGEVKTERRPINPKENTGYTGRGLLWHWGANFAGDPIITREDPVTGELQVLLIQRQDTGAWALPGGMVDPGEEGLITAFREAFEEVGVTLSPEQIAGARQVYQGYVHDPRNTNNAWMETTAFHVHLSREEAAKITVKADVKETRGYKWEPLNEETLGKGAYYASHDQLLKLALEEFKGKASQEPETPDTMSAKLQDLTVEITALPKSPPERAALEQKRKDLAVEYVYSKLKERPVDGRTVGNNEIASIVERYITDKEATDVQVLLLEGKYTDKVLDKLMEISAIGSQSLIESLSRGVENGHNILASQEEYESKYTGPLKAVSAFYAKEEIEKFKNEAEYWKAEENWIIHRKTTDNRWSKSNPDGTPKTPEQERADADSLLAYAKEKLEPQLAGLLQIFVQSAGLTSGAFVNVSYRTKGVESSLRKLAKLRAAPWAQGKDVSIADLVDLLGGRIVVDDLQALENVMLAVERAMQDPRFMGMQVLRKENKFIANDGKPDPYRAIQYTITFPGADGEQYTFELQLKTFASMISSDLFHNAVFKPEILNLPTGLQQTVREYNWRSDIEEAVAYLAVKGVRGQGKSQKLSQQQKVEKAIAERDWNAFYDLVLSRIDDSVFADKQRWIEFYDQVNAAMNKEVEFLNELRQRDPELVNNLARASHDNGYYLTNDVAGTDGKSGVIHDPGKPMLTPELDADTVARLTEKGQEAYGARYEKFKGNNNKLTVGQLDLMGLSEQGLKDFFIAAGKNVNSNAVAQLIMDILSLQGMTAEELKINPAKKILSKPVINLYHQTFDEMVTRGREIRNESARQKWEDAIVDNQIKAVAASVLLTEIGSFDQNGDPRDLGRPAFEGSEFSLREKLTHEIWVFAQQYDGEYFFDGLDRNGQADPEGWRSADGEGRGKMSYRQFVTAQDERGNQVFQDQINLNQTIDAAIQRVLNLKFQDQINLDRTIDTAVNQTLNEVLLHSIEQKARQVLVNGVESADRFMLAKLQSIKAEYLAKYIKALVLDRALAEKLTAYINGRLGSDSEALVRGNGAATRVLEAMAKGLRDEESRRYEHAAVWRSLQLNDQKQGVIEILRPVALQAGLSASDVTELRKIIVDNSMLTESFTKLPVIGQIRDGIRRGSAVILGAPGTGKTEQLTIALHEEGRQEVVFDLRARALAALGANKDTYWDLQTKEKELEWLKKNVSVIQQQLIDEAVAKGPGKAVVVMDEFDLSVDKTLNETESESARIIMDIAGALKAAGIPVVLILHANGVNTTGILDHMKSCGLIEDANRSALVQTGYLPAEFEKGVLFALALNDEEVSSFMQFAQGLPAAYLGAIEAVSKGNEYGATYAEMIAASIQAVMANYKVAQNVDPQTAGILERIAKGEQRSEGLTSAEEDGLIATGLVGRQDGRKNSPLVMPDAVRYVVENYDVLSKQAFEMGQLESKVADFARLRELLDAPHYNADWHIEGGKKARLRDHLQVMLDVLNASATRMGVDEISQGLRSILDRVNAATREDIEAAVLFHDIGKPEKSKLKADGLSHSFHGHEELSFRLITAENQPLYAGRPLSKQVIFAVQNHGIHYTLSEEPVSTFQDVIAQWYADYGGSMEDFKKAMELLIALTTLDGMGSVTSTGRHSDLDPVNKLFEGYQMFLGDVSGSSSSDASMKNGFLQEAMPRDIDLRSLYEASDVSGLLEHLKGGKYFSLADIKRILISKFNNAPGIDKRIDQVIKDFGASRDMLEIWRVVAGDTAYIEHKESEGFHPVYLARDGGALFTIRDAVERLKSNGESGADGTVFHCSVNSVPDDIDTTSILDAGQERWRQMFVQEWTSDKEIKSRVSDSSVYVQQRAKEMHAEIKKDLIGRAVAYIRSKEGNREFMSAIDKKYKELEKLGVLDHEKILWIDTGWKGSMPFMMEAIVSYKDPSKQQESFLIHANNNVHVTFDPQDPYMNDNDDNRKESRIVSTIMSDANRMYFWHVGDPRDNISAIEEIPHVIKFNKEKEVLEPVTEDAQIESAVFSYYYLLNSAMAKAKKEYFMGSPRNGVKKQILAEKDLGGIDLNSSNLNLQIKRDGNGVPLPVSSQDLDNIRIDGLTPQIILIQPATNLPILSDALAAISPPSA